MNALTVTEVLAGIVLLGGVSGVVIKWVAPVFKLNKRIDSLERHESENFQKINNIDSNVNLIGKAVLALVNNRLTNNSVDKLEAIKNEMESKRGFIS